MKNITSRKYTDNDLPHLQAALAGWIQSAGDCGYCHVGDISHRIYNGIRGRLSLNEVVRVWEDDSQIIGFDIVGPYYNRFDTFVHPDYRGTESERDMLQWAYTTTRHFMNIIGRADKPVLAEECSGDDIRAQLLIELGFEKHEHWGNITERRLDDVIPEPSLPDGFSIRAATMDDYAQLAAVHSGAFGSNWSPELYRDEVMLNPGYRVEREIVVVASDGQFAAFTKTWLDEVNKVGLFEPVGTHKDFQRKGLGRAMMLHTLHEMKSLGMKTAMVGHEADNPASIGLYNSLGFRTKYEIADYKKL